MYSPAEASDLLVEPAVLAIWRPISTPYPAPVVGRMYTANRSAPVAFSGRPYSNDAAKVVPSCAPKIRYVLIFLNFMAANESMIIIVPAYAPVGMYKSRVLKVLNPKPRMTSGAKVEIAPFETMLRRAMKNNNQNFMSVSNSTT